MKVLDKTGLFSCQYRFCIQYSPSSLVLCNRYGIIWIFRWNDAMRVCFVAELYVALGVDTFYDHGWTHYGTVITRWHMVWSVRDAQTCLLGSTGLSLLGEGAMWL